MATVTETIVEKYTEAELEELLRQLLECEDDIVIMGNTFSRFDILKEMSPNDFKMACDELQEDVVEYTCDECGCEYDNELDAELCCDCEEEEC